MKIRNLIFSGLLALLTNSPLLAQVPVLNSYPAAAPTVYLDFDGETISNTIWNALGMGGNYVCPAANVTTSEINAIFNLVAEDFRPFTLNITTDYTRYTAAMPGRRVRVVLTTYWQYMSASPMAPGLSMMNCFSDGSETPLLVYTSLLNSGVSPRVKNIADVISHEVGHALGLAHQAAWNASCNLQQEYYTGLGSGQAGWAPIMGAGYYRNRTTWYNGTAINGCQQFQNDLELITNPRNGISFRTDDYSDLPEQAFPLQWTGNTSVTNGEIATNSDADYFRFTLPNTRRVHLNANPVAADASLTGANLDIKLSLFDNRRTDGREVNPDDLLSAFLDTVLPAGDYYIKVQGQGSHLAPAYAVLGGYILNVTTAAATTLALHSFFLAGAAQGSTHTLNWKLEADETVVEQVLEASADGNGYNRVSEILPAGRTWSGQMQDRSTYYRVRVRLSDGKLYYSNTVLLRGKAADARPRVEGTVSSGGAVVVSSPLACGFSLVDLNGAIVYRGRLVPGTNTLHLPALRSGIFLLAYADEGNRFGTDRILVP